MKIICDCGNEVNLVEPNDSEERTYDPDEGFYVRQDEHGKFDFWERHDQIGIVCNECLKGIWMFT